VVYLTLAHAGLFLLYLGWRSRTFDAFRVPPDAASPALREALRIAAFAYAGAVVLVLPAVLAIGAAPVVRQAREAGARAASPLLPLLVGFLLLVAQVFSVQFIAYATRPW
jgi:hypothetical protein